MDIAKKILVITFALLFASLSLFASGAVEELEKSESVPVEAEAAPATVERPVYGTLDKSDMYSAFSHAYGYMITKSILDQGISLNGAYWLRGIDDVYSGSAEPLIAAEEMSAVIDEYAVSFYQAGETAEAGDMPTYDEIKALGVPESILDKFSYSYGVMYSVQLYYYNGLDITGPEFMDGAAEALWPRDEKPMTEEEMDAAIAAYSSYLDQLYAEYVETLKVENLAEAESFLSENKDEEGVIVLPSGNQMIIISSSDTLGETPSATDSVIVDYDLFLLDGNTYDSGSDVTFSLQSLIPGFTEAVTNMQVGQEAMVYIHPSYGYGENGTSNIEPNSLLIFRINLKGIAK